MNMFERIIYDPRRGMYHEFEGLNTHFEPKDPALYRKLLPEPLAMPSQPVVTVFAADYLHVTPWPMIRYQEWSVLVKSLLNGEEGWYCLTMPVTTRVALYGGRYLGFPKYLANKITLARSEETCIATGKYRDIVEVTLEFQPGITRPLVAWEKELAENVSFFKGDIHLFVPPGRGPRLQKIIFRHVVPPIWSPINGMVCIRAGSSEPWAGLIPDEGKFPGTYNHFKGGFNLISERIF
jgi:hypothetical protein